MRQCHKLMGCLIDRIVNTGVNTSICIIICGPWNRSLTFGTRRGSIACIFFHM